MHISLSLSLDNSVCCTFMIECVLLILQACMNVNVGSQLWMYECKHVLVLVRVSVSVRIFAWRCIRAGFFLCLRACMWRQCMMASMRVYVLACAFAIRRRASSLFARISPKWLLQETFWIWIWMSWRRLFWTCQHPLSVFSLTLACKLFWPQIIRSDEVQVPEETQVFGAALHWLEAALVDRDEDISLFEQNILPLIRFSTMTSVQLDSTIAVIQGSCLQDSQVLHQLIREVAYSLFLLFIFFLVLLYSNHSLSVLFDSFCMDRPWSLDTKLCHRCGGTVLQKIPKNWCKGGALPLLGLLLQVPAQQLLSRIRSCPQMPLQLHPLSVLVIEHCFCCWKKQSPCDSDLGVCASWPLGAHSDVVWEEKFHDIFLLVSFKFYSGLLLEEYPSTFCTLETTMVFSISWAAIMGMFFLKALVHLPKSGSPHTLFLACAPFWLIFSSSMVESPHGRILTTQN